MGSKKLGLGEGGGGREEGSRGRKRRGGRGGRERARREGRRGARRERQGTNAVRKRKTEGPEGGRKVVVG